MVTSAVLADFLDRLLAVAEHPDYPQALNGLQLANCTPITRIGAAVDLSLSSIESARGSSVNFLIVHHGMFWEGLQRIVGAAYDRLQLLIQADIAVYSAHLPLDSHPEFGNAALLAQRIGLNPTGGFAKYSGVSVGVRGDCDIPTADLVGRVSNFVTDYKTVVRTTPMRAEQRTRRWAVCTGSGASSETLREAAATKIDTLIVGEGPHYTAVAASELGITVVYAGHYATETLGVQAIAGRASAEYGLPWEFISAPTGL